MHIRLLIAFSLAIVAALSAAVPTRAAETRSGDEILIATSDVVDGDLYFSGRKVVIAGTVQGDLIGIAETIEITGTVNGSVNVAARVIEVSGTVTRSVRAAGAEVEIGGNIGGDVLVSAGDVTITESGSVIGDLLVGSGNVRTNGPIDGDVRGSAGEVTINSDIGGSVRLAAGQVTITDEAEIGGDLRYASDVEAEVDEQSQVSGQIVRTSTLRSIGGPDLFSALTSQIMRVLIGLITGLFLLLLLPRPIVNAADVIRSQFLVAGLTGIASVIIWPILAVLLMVIVVGVPVALIGTVFLLIVAYLSQIFVGLALGRSILPGSWQVDSRGYNILAMAIGVIVIGAVRSLPVPYVATALAFVVAVIGIGGVVLSLQSRSAPAANAQ